MGDNGIPKTAVHSYNVSVAADVGINAAVLFYNICFWVRQNKANKKNYVDGKYWTYNTVDAFKMLFPEMSYEQIRNALRKLENNNYIKSAFLDEDPMVRTKWYTVVDEDEWIGLTKCNCENSQMESAEKPDVNNIYNNINNKTDNKQNTDDKQTDNSHKSNTFSPEEEKGIGNTFSEEKGSYPVPAKDYVHKNHITEYTQEQLVEHINSRIEYYMDKDYLCFKDSDTVKELEKIILYFYGQYYKKTGKKHPIISDYGYRKIVRDYKEPPDIMSEYEIFDFEYYKPMIDKYFNTDFNARGKYKHKIELSLSHFMSDKIREYLYYQVNY